MLYSTPVNLQLSLSSLSFSTHFIPPVPVPSLIIFCSSLISTHIFPLLLKSCMFPNSASSTPSVAHFRVALHSVNPPLPRSSLLLHQFLLPLLYQPHHLSTPILLLFLVPFIRCVFAVYSFSPISLTHMQVILVRGTFS